MKLDKVLIHRLQKAHEEAATVLIHVKAKKLKGDNLSGMKMLEKGVQYLEAVLLDVEEE